MSIYRAPIISEALSYTSSWNLPITHNTTKQSCTTKVSGKMAVYRRNAPKLSPFHFMALPGEIRNKIFDYYIMGALKSSKSQPRSSSAISPKSRHVAAAIFPRWNGPVLMRVEGLAALPLLFANKQVYSELSFLVFSKLDRVSIGGYPLQYPDENPDIRWKLAYSHLEKQPGLLKFTRNVTVSMPCMREDLHRIYWASLKLKAPKISIQQHNTWAVVPGLRAFLSTFENLSELKIVVTTEDRPAPDFEGLLPMYDICGKNTTIDFVAPLGIWTSWVSVWSFAWEECLRKTGRI